MGRLRAKCEYENLRNARVSENKARMESLGLSRSVDELRSIVSSTKLIQTTITRKYRKAKPDLSTPPRRSDRLKSIYCNKDSSSTQVMSAPAVDKKTYVCAVRKRLFSGGNRARGTIYDPVVGICCHFCRQKKLCGEDGCKRCENGDVDEPCIGKTDCSICHSSNGILCRACLKVRYGEEMGEVRMKDWICPHCTEEKGINPYWICNSSFCLKKRKMAPTGIAIYEARQKGYESVAHLIMDQLKQNAA